MATPSFFCSRGDRTKHRPSQTFDLFDLFLVSFLVFPLGSTPNANEEDLKGTPREDQRRDREAEEAEPWLRGHLLELGQNQPTEHLFGDEDGYPPW